MCSDDGGILYADNAVPVYVGTSLEMLTGHVNSRLREIFECCNCKKLSLNKAKSDFYCDQHDSSKRPQLLNGADPITEVDRFKFLGIHAQINHLKEKLSQLC